MSRATIAGRLAALVVIACLSTHAYAAAQRTFVSGAGIDNPACSLAAPCRQFAAAVMATSPNGEVIVLDSAGYGIVTISQAVSIIAPPGVYAGISVFAGNDGVTVSAGATDKVRLRGLTINGQGGNNGIHVTSGGTIRIEDCTMSNMLVNGILIEGGTTVDMARIVASGNGANGVFVQPAGAITITATLADSRVTGNVVIGFRAITPVAGSTINAVLTRVTASRNLTGFNAGSANMGTITMTVADSIAAENVGNGLLVSGSNATAIVSGSSLVHNTSFDLVQSDPAVLRTAGNNAVTGRGANDIAGTLTANPPK